MCLLWKTIVANSVSPPPRIHEGIIRFDVDQAIWVCRKKRKASVQENTPWLERCLSVFFSFFMFGICFGGDISLRKSFRGNCLWVRRSRLSHHSVPSPSSPPSSYTFPADIYSLGVLAIVLVCLDEPTNSGPSEAQLSHLTRLSTPTKDLIRSMLSAVCYFSSPPLLTPPPHPRPPLTVPPPRP